MENCSKVLLESNRVSFIRYASDDNCFYFGIRKDNAFIFLTKEELKEIIGALVD